MVPLFFNSPGLFLTLVLITLKDPEALKKIFGKKISPINSFYQKTFYLTFNWKIL